MSLSSTWCPEMFVLSKLHSREDTHMRVCVRVRECVCLYQCVPWRWWPSCSCPAPASGWSPDQTGPLRRRVWSPHQTWTRWRSKNNKLLKNYWCAYWILICYHCSFAWAAHWPSCVYGCERLYDMWDLSPSFLSWQSRSKQRVSRWFSALSPDPTQSPLLTWFSHYRP